MTQTNVPDGLQLTPYDEHFQRDPYSVYRRLRESEPVHRDAQTLYARSWTISEFELVKRLLSDRRVGVDPRRVGIPRDPRADNAITRQPPDLISLDPPEHTRLRSLITKSFTPSSVASFLPRIESIVDSLLGALPQSGEVELVANLCDKLPTQVIAEFIGIDPERHADFRRWTKALALQGHPIPTEAQWQTVIDADAELRAYAAEAVIARRADPQDDLLTRMIWVSDGEHSLTHNEIVQMVVLLIGAGNFTTVDALSNALHTWLRSSNELRALAAQEDNAAFVDECLRYDSSVLSVRRFVLEPIELDGATLQTGDVLTLVLAAANHDSAQFEAPDQFCPATKQPPHLVFGRGIHHCLGAALARAQLGVALRGFASRFPNARFIELKRTKSMGFRGCKTLHVDLK